MEHKHESVNDGALKSKANIALVVFLLIGAYFLATEHWAHISGWIPYWPYLLLLACPLMHVFMHGGHGGHGDHGSQGGHGCCGPSSSDAPNDSTKEKK